MTVKLQFQICSVAAVMAKFLNMENTKAWFLSCGVAAVTAKTGNMENVKA